MRAENTAKQRFAGRRPPDISLILDPALDVSAQHLFFRENPTMGKPAIGVIGLAVMGRNLALNIESRGHAVAVYNRSRTRTEEMLAEFRGRNLVPAYTLQAFVDSLEKPRRILMMVQAGAATDATIAALK